MLVGLPVLPTEIFARLPDEHRLGHIETEWSRSRGSGGLHSFLEGPAFDNNGDFWCVDLAHGRIFRISPSGEWHLFQQYSGRPNGLKIGPDGRIVVADAVNGILSFDPQTAERRVVLSEYGGQKLQGPNDLTFAANGDLYLTDPGSSDLRHRNGRVFRIRASGEVELLLEGLAYPNGLVLAPGQDILYVTLTAALQVVRLALRPDVVGTHKCSLFIQLSGGLAGPDGVTVDPAGNLYVAHSGLFTVWQFDRYGEPLARLRSCTGARTTNLVLSPDGNSVYITESESGTILRPASRQLTQTATRSGSLVMNDTCLNVATAAPHVAIVTLVRPPVNALGRDIREAMLRVFDRLEGEADTRSIVLAAEGRVFCAGADIKEKSAEAGIAGDYVRANRLIRDVFFAILDSSKPVIAAVQGAALGAGCVLAACCDMIFAAETAVFGMPEIDVGQGGGASILRRILPLSKLRRMLLTGERVSAAEFYRLGAVEACLPQAELLPAAIAMATTIASKSPFAVRRIRGSFPAVEALDVREGFRVEQIYTTELSRSPDAAEARRAFFEKRKPTFE